MERGAWGVKREAWCVGREDSDESSVKPKRGAGGDRKAPKRSQFALVLIIGISQFRTNQGGIEQAKRTQFPAGGKGWWWSRGGRTVVTGSRTVASESVSQGDNALRPRGLAVTEKRQNEANLLGC